LSFYKNFDTLSLIAIYVFIREQLTKKLMANKFIYYESVVIVIILILIKQRNLSAIQNLFVFIIM